MSCDSSRFPGVVNMCAASSAVRTRRWWATVLAGALLAGGSLTACATGPPQSSFPVYELRVATFPGLGRFLVDGRGFTLYAYRPDRQGRPACTGLCGQQWPPLLLPSGLTTIPSGPGVRASLIGTTVGEHGSAQLTYRGWPLYRWDGDTSPGRVTGQGDDMGLWGVISPDGQIDRNPPGA
jgi:predicted lipoprotein with Yx(FWY)xxD motif